MIFGEDRECVSMWAKFTGNDQSTNLQPPDNSQQDDGHLRLYKERESLMLLHLSKVFPRQMAVQRFLCENDRWPLVGILP